MNRLKEFRLRRGLTQPQVSASLRDIEPRADVAMVSRYESGVCLPTPPQMERIEAILQADRLQFYDKADIDLAHNAKPAKRHDTHRAGYVRKCYRMARERSDRLPGDLLQVCGYTSWQSWHDACIKRLLGEYAAIKKALAKKGVK